MRFPADAPVTPGRRDELRERLARLGVDLARVEEEAVRPGGPGGQKANKTSSGVRLHYQLGAEVLVVRCARERRHSLNRFRALRDLAAAVERRISPATSERLREAERRRKQKDRRRRRRA